MQINIQPTPKQWELFEAFDKPGLNHILTGGGVNSGKSYGLCTLILIKMLQYPGIRVGLGRKNLTTLKITTLETFFKVLLEVGYPDEKYNYNQQKNRLKLDNGSEIFLLDMDYYPQQPNYERLQGLELTFAVCDEVGELPERTGYDVLSSRTGRHLNKKYGIKPMVISTCNPSENFIKEMFYIPWKNGILSDDRTYIPALITDNPHVSPEYLQNLYNTLDDLQIKRLIKGDWDYSQSDLDLFLHEDITNCYIQREIEKVDEKYLTVDIAVDADDCVAIYWEGLVVKDIIINDKKTDPVLFIKELQKKYLIPLHNIVYDASGIGGIIKRQLPSARAFTGASKAIKANYKNIRHQCYFSLSDAVRNNEIRFDTDKYKERIIRELKAHKRKEIVENKVELIPKKDIIRSIGKSPDIADCLSMRMIFEVHNPQVMIF